MEGVAVSGGFRHRAGASPSTLTTIPLPLIEPNVRISRTRLSFEIMPSHTQSWPSAPAGAIAARPVAGARPGTARTARANLVLPERSPKRPLGLVSVDHLLCQTALARQK